jgi:hypothetical protein
MATPFAVLHQTDTRSVTVLHLVADSSLDFFCLWKRVGQHMSICFERKIERS